MPADTLMKHQESTASFVACLKFRWQCSLPRKAGQEFAVNKHGSWKQPQCQLDNSPEYCLSQTTKEMNYSVRPHRVINAVKNRRGMQNAEILNCKRDAEQQLNRGVGFLKFFFAFFVLQNVENNAKSSSDKLWLAASAYT